MGGEGDVILRMTFEQYEALMELMVLVVEHSPEFTTPDYALEAKKLVAWFEKQARVQEVS